MPLEEFKVDTREVAGPGYSSRASVQRVIQRKKGQAGRAVVVGRNMERYETDSGRSSYDMLISVILLIGYSPQVVTSPAVSAPANSVPAALRNYSPGLNGGGYIRVWIASTAISAAEASRCLNGSRILAM